MEIVMLNEVASSEKEGEIVMLYQAGSSKKEGATGLLGNKFPSYHYLQMDKYSDTVHTSDFV